eukprot:FR736596.1.p1 GENE.FR736596.1~~FR736596.1.p1  ORF type:complete len:161 (-),score=48.73 FR736596.1:674-1156(-)
MFSGVLLLWGGNLGGGKQISPPGNQVLGPGFPPRGRNLPLHKREQKGGGSPGGGGRFRIRGFPWVLDLGCPSWGPFFFFFFFFLTKSGITIAAHFIHKINKIPTGMSLPTSQQHAASSPYSSTYLLIYCMCHVPHPDAATTTTPYLTGCTWINPTLSACR